MCSQANKESISTFSYLQIFSYMNDMSRLYLVLTRLASCLVLHTNFHPINPSLGNLLWHSQFCCKDSN